MVRASLNHSARVAKSSIYFFQSIVSCSVFTCHLNALGVVKTIGKDFEACRVV